MAVVTPWQYLLWPPFALFIGCISATRPSAQSDMRGVERFEIVRSHFRGLAGIHTGKAVTASLTEDPAAQGERTLAIDYQAAQGPADRDTWFDVDLHDWSGAVAVGLRIRSEQPLHMSLSFFDGNRVAYTAWADVRAGAWQDVRVSLETIRPNPYFQRPDAKVGAPLDLRDIEMLAFAPQVPGPGRLLVGDLVLWRKAHRPGD